MLIKRRPGIKFFKNLVPTLMKIPVEISARHVHLSKKDLEILFGSGCELTKRKDLSQPGQYAAEERLEIQGPNGVIKNVAILGPTRLKTQVEVSLTDCRKLGTKAFIRESGDLKGTESCVLVGPCGTCEISEGLIVALRHIHMAPSDADDLGVLDQQIVKVKIKSDNRSVIFDDVIVRVSNKFSLAMHVDTDEGNAANCVVGTFGEIVK